MLLDTEGIDAYDQTGQYSTQIFSLAVLLSSLFVYNQMGGIDEAALDRLSLVTEVTKHVRVRAGSAGGASTILRSSCMLPVEHVPAECAAHVVAGGPLAMQRQGLGACVWRVPMEVARKCHACMLLWSRTEEQPMGAFVGEAEENELANFTPAFLWLLRDFYLTLEEDGRQARLFRLWCQTGLARN